MRASLGFLARFVLAAGVLFGCWNLLAPVYLAMIAPLVNGVFRLTALPVQLELQGQVLLLAYRLPDLALRLEAQDYHVVYLNLIAVLALITASAGRGAAWKIQWSMVAVLLLWITHTITFWITGHLAIWQYAQAMPVGAARERLLSLLSAEMGAGPWVIPSALLAQWNIWGRYSLPVAVWFFAVRKDPVMELAEAGLGPASTPGAPRRRSWGASDALEALAARMRRGAGWPRRQPGLLPLASVALLLVLVASGCDSAPTAIITPPVADAGPDQQIESGAEVRLDGSASITEDGADPDYMWAQLDGPAQVPITDATSAQATVHVVLPGVYVFRMTVTDATGAADADQVNVLVTQGSASGDPGGVPGADDPPDPVNTPPQADTGPDLQGESTEVFVLDGSASADADGDPLTFSWVQTGGPQALAITDADAPRAAITAPDPGSYQFRLTVTDPRGQSSSDVLRLIVLPRPDAETPDDDGSGAPPDDHEPDAGDGAPDAVVNRTPNAVAGGDVDADPGQLVVLDGSGSSDPEGAPLTYAWVQLSGPESLVIGGAESVLASVAPERPGDYLFRLSVTDPAGLEALDVVRVRVRAVAVAGVVIISADPVPPAATRVAYRISGTGMSELRGEMLITQDQVARRSVLGVSAGPARVIEVTAFDNRDVGLAYGITVVDMGATLQQARVAMQPLASGVGDIRVDVIFASED